jgi:hypothetical protein
MFMRPIIFAAFALPMTTIVGCAPVDSTPQPLTDKQSEQRAKLLAGKLAGKPMNCISDYGSTNMIRISDDIVHYRVSGNLVYENRLRSNCPGLADNDDIIVSEQYGSQKCSGDLLRLVDRTSGIQGPVCILGEFVPYRKDKNAG